MRDGYVGLYVDRIEATPGPCTSPNARCDWRRKAKQVAELREAARLAAVDARARRNWAKPLPPRGDLALHWTVFWGHREKRKDVTNFIGCAKAAEDGIFEALGMNDARVVEVRVEQHRAEGRQGWMSCCVIALDEESEA